MFILFLILALVPSRVHALRSDERERAVVVVSAREFASRTAVLVKNPFPSLPDDDSSPRYLFDSTGVLSFDLIPDPEATYSLTIGTQHFCANFCLAPGDSLRFMGDSKQGLRLEYDKLGANAAGAKLDDGTTPPEYWKLIQDTTSNSQRKFCRLIDSVEKTLWKHALWFTQTFPLHVKLQRHFTTVAQYYHSTAVSDFYWERRREVGSGAKWRVGGIWADSAKLDFPSTIDVWRVSHLVTNIVGLRLWRWYKDGKDTAGIDAYGLRKKLEFASQMRGPARDLALWCIALDAKSNYGDSLALLIIDSALRWENSDTSNAPFVKSIVQMKLALRGRAIGSPLKDFALTDQNQKIHKLSDYKGKVVLLHFWGTWCGPCLEQLPEFLAFEERHKNDTNVVMVGIAAEMRNFEGWKSFLKKHKMKGIEFYAEGQSESEVALAYHISAFPSVIIADRDGTMVYCSESAPSNEDLERALLRAKSH